jgi:hypothetical protein
LAGAAADRVGRFGRADLAGVGASLSVPRSTASFSFWATASSTVDEWLLATTPIAPRNSRTSLLDRPRSLASS